MKFHKQIIFTSVTESGSSSIDGRIYFGGRNLDALTDLASIDVETDAGGILDNINQAVRNLQKVISRARSGFLQNYNVRAATDSGSRPGRFIIYRSGFSTASYRLTLPRRSFSTNNPLADFILDLSLIHI